MTTTPTRVVHSAVPVTGLPAVRYWAAWRPQREEQARGFLAFLAGDRDEADRAAGA